jgi:hypothetical protein
MVLIIRELFHIEVPVFLVLMPSEVKFVVVLINTNRYLSALKALGTRPAYKVNLKENFQQQIRLQHHKKWSFSLR